MSRSPVSPHAEPLGLDDLEAVVGGGATNGQDQGHLLFGTSANDRIDGGSGADTIYGEAGADSIRGGSGDDVINGGDGNDTICGDMGNDTIHGGAGDDLFKDSVGDDVVYGDAGNDTYNWHPEYNVGVQTFNGGPGNDVIAVTGYVTAKLDNGTILKPDSNYIIDVSGFSGQLVDDNGHVLKFTGVERIEISLVRQGGPI